MFACSDCIFVSHRSPTMKTSTCEQYADNQLRGRREASVLYKKKLFHLTKDKTNNRQCSIQCVYVVSEQCTHYTKSTFSDSPFDALPGETYLLNMFQKLKYLSTNMCLSFNVKLLNVRSEWLLILNEYLSITQNIQFSSKYAKKVSAHIKHYL